jgi:hypothetical protein
MVSNESSGGGGEEGFTGRAAIGYDHGYDGQLFYLGLALDEKYVEGFVEGCLQRIGEDYPEEEQLFRDLWLDETQRDVVIESLKADCEVRVGRPPEYRWSLKGATLPIVRCPDVGRHWLYCSGQSTSLLLLREAACGGGMVVGRDSH